jgi:paraquat-inducible protein B
VKRYLPWLVPLAALIAALVLGWQAFAQRGPTIHVEFERAEGLAPGDPVSYRGVRIGDVRAVRLAPDLAKVIVEARLRSDAANIARDGSSFWIVRPEISASRVTGLDTLLGPRYLECEPGSGKPRTHFAGLSRPPGKALPGHGALEVIVEAPDRGSLVIDSPVSYRGIRVGAVRSLELSSNARVVEIVLNIDPEYRNLVCMNSRFWSIGGIGVDWGIIRGLSVKAESLERVMAGGIAFATPNKPGEPVQSGQRFTLAGEAKPEWLEWSPAIDVQPSR